MGSRRMLAGTLVLGLLLVLVMGPGLAQEPEEAARPAGFARHTVYRARQQLGAALGETGSGPRDPRKCWTLAEGEDEAVVPIY